MTDFQKAVVNDRLGAIQKYGEAAKISPKQAAIIMGIVTQMKALGYRPL